MAESIIIKKYPNRRLYNTANSTYITLDDVAGLIREGNQVQILDVNTGEDLTATVLTQIIMNKAKEDKSILPVSLLHLVIQYGESHLHEFFEKYLEISIQNYLGIRKKMDDQLKTYMEMGMDLSSFSQKAFQGMNPMNLFSKSPPEEDEN